MMAKAKRGNSEGSLYQRGDGKWCAAYTLPGGRRKVLYAATRAEASKRLTAALKAVHDGLPAGGDERLTVRTFLAGWLANTARPRLRPKSFDAVRCWVEQHIIPELGTIRLTQLRTPTIQAFLNRKHAAGLSPKTVKHIRDAMRAAFNDAVRWGLIVRNPASGANPPRIPKHHVEPLTQAEALALLQAVQSHRLAALFTVALAVGLRAGEALGLRWQDLDLDSEAPLLHVRHAFQRIEGNFQLVEPKTESSRRSIPLPTVAVAALREHRRAQLQERLQCGGHWRDEIGLVFTRPDGSPVYGQNLSRTFQELLTAAGLPPRRFHDLRHACCSLLLAQGVPPGTVMAILGHSSLQTTMMIYREVTQDAARQGMAAMEFLAAR